MYPILARYGRFFLYSYTAVLGLGIVAAVALTRYRTRRHPVADWPDGIVAAFMAALGAGRFGYVVGQWPYFRANTAEVWRIWEGGLSYHGVLVGALAGLWLWCWWTDTPFAWMLGLLAPVLPLLSAFGWAACWLEGCAFGRETVIGWWSADLPDAYGVFAVRYQTQVGGMLWSLLVLAIVWRYRWRFNGVGLFALALLGVSSGRFLLNFLRGDPVPLLAGIRIDLWLDGILSLLGLLLLQWKASVIGNR